MAVKRWSWRWQQAAALRRASRTQCSDCERCTWNPGPDCGRADHAHCKTCGHCFARHRKQHDDRFEPCASG